MHVERPGAHQVSVQQAKDRVFHSGTTLTKLKASQICISKWSRGTARTTTHCSAARSGNSLGLGSSCLASNEQVIGGEEDALAELWGI